MRDVLLYALAVFSVGFTLAAGNFACHLILGLIFPTKNPNADHLLAMQKRNILLEVQNEIHRESVEAGRLAVENNRMSLEIIKKANKGKESE